MNNTDLIYFISDDKIINKDILKKINYLFKKYSDLGAVGLNNGQILNKNIKKKIDNIDFQFVLWADISSIIFRKKTLEKLGYYNDILLSNYLTFKCYLHNYSVGLLKCKQINNSKLELINEINVNSKLELINEKNERLRYGYTNRKLKIYYIFHDILDFKLFEGIKKYSNYVDFIYTGENDLSLEYKQKLERFNVIIEKDLPRFDKKYKQLNYNTINYNKSYTALYHIIKNNLYHYNYIGGINFKFSLNDSEIEKVLNNENCIFYYETTKERNKPIPPDTWPKTYMAKYKTVDAVYHEIIKRCNTLLNTNFTYSEIMDCPDRPYIRHGFTGCIIPLKLFNKIKIFLKNNILDWGVYMERVYAILLIMCTDYKFMRLKSINYSKHFVKNLGYTKPKINIARY